MLIDNERMQDPTATMQTPSTALVIIGEQRGVKRSGPSPKIWAAMEEAAYPSSPI